ncbi:MAG: hypothetical protein KDE04_23225 [Anaerolineales bacterium]|nr:hypothetical protein [Anaerolineales bacterium]
MLREKPCLYQIFDRAILLFFGLLVLCPCAICSYTQFWPLFDPANDPGRRICKNLKQSGDLPETATCWQDGPIRDYIYLYFPLDETTPEKVQRGMADFDVSSEGRCRWEQGGCLYITYRMSDSILSNYVKFYFLGRRLVEIDVSDD